MRRFALLIPFLVLVLFIVSAFADDAIPRKQTVEKIEPRAEYLPQFRLRHHPTDSKWPWPSGMEPYLGCRVDTVGYTYYEMQHNRSCGRNVVLDSDGTSHICWMYSGNTSHNPRHIYYNLTTHGGDQIEGSERIGIPVDGSTKAGYTNITLAMMPFYPDTLDYSEEIPIVAYHFFDADHPEYLTGMSWDGAKRVSGAPGGFVWSEDGTGESVPPGATPCSEEYDEYYGDFFCTCSSAYAMQAIWPRVAANANGDLYLLSTNNGDVDGNGLSDTLCGQEFPTYVVFWSGQPAWNGSYVHQFDFTEPLLLDLQSSIVCDIDVDMGTGEIAVAYFDVYDTNDCTRLSPDDGVYYAWLQAISTVYRKSTDGGVTWTERTQIMGSPEHDGYWSLDEIDTQYVPAVYVDTTTYGEPDTAYYCAIDTYDVFYRSLWGTGINLAYDPFGNLHSVFTARMYHVSDYDDPCSVNVYYGSVIMHWDEASGEITKVCPPRFTNSNLLPGVENADADETCIHPSIAFDKDGNVYVCWLQAWPRYYAFKDSLWNFIDTHPDTLWSSSEDWAEYEALFDSVLGEYYDMSAGEVANYDVFIARSFNGGSEWTTPLNISNSYSSDCIPGECLCELDMSIAKDVDDQVHIFCVLDKDAGRSVQDVGETVQCPVLHIAVDTTALADVGITEYSKSKHPDRLMITASPNPFNSASNIIFTNPMAGNITVDILDISGRVVRTLHDGFVTTGTHAVVWDGTDDNRNEIPSGTYMCRIKTDSGIRAAKIMLIK